MEGGLDTLTIGQCATLACLLEVTANKPGNVYPGADFQELTLNDFLVSAVSIGPAMQHAAGRPIGLTVLAAVRATRTVVQTNTNLGTLLLLAPLAKVGLSQPLRAGVGEVLDSLAETDASEIYEAIRLASPGGMGRVDEMDVTGPSPPSLLDAMRAAAERDLVARQYVNRFEQVFDASGAWLVEAQEAGWTLRESIVRTHVRLMATFPDSLIARKCGQQLADESACRAAEVLSRGVPGDANYEKGLGELDGWLRADGNRRNPGTTADLITAGLFVALRNEMLDLS